MQAGGATERAHREIAASGGRSRRTGLPPAAALLRRSSSSSATRRNSTAARCDLRAPRARRAFWPARPMRGRIPRRSVRRERHWRRERSELTVSRLRPKEGQRGSAPPAENAPRPPQRRFSGRTTHDRQRSYDHPPIGCRTGAMAPFRRTLARHAAEPPKRKGIPNMIRARRPLLPALALGLATAALAAPGAAVAAKGGAAAPPATDPAAAPVLCDFSFDGPVAGGFVFSNQVGAAGCLRVLVTTTVGAPQVSVESIATTPGW